MPKALLVPCPQTLPALADGNAATVGLAMKDWADQYHDCRILQAGLVEALRDQVKAK